MAVRVLLPNAFQKHTNNTREITSEAANLPELITEIEGRFPALRKHLRGEDGQIRRFINFYVNEEDIRFLGNENYRFQEGDEVTVIEALPRIAVTLDGQAGRLLDRMLRREGLNFRLQTKVTGAEKTGGGVKLLLDSNGAVEEAPF